MVGQKDLPSLSTCKERPGRRIRHSVLRGQLEQAIAHLEAQRATLGDAVVDAAVYRHSAQLLSERLSAANGTLQALGPEPAPQPAAGPC